MRSKFNTSLDDAQATEVVPVSPEQFDLERYASFVAEMENRCRSFTRADSGILVYRKVRVAEVFTYGCREMAQSLAWQLGALQKSMEYLADVPNFLEPWYGIGTGAAAFDLDYHWGEGQAPAVKTRFSNVEEALQAELVPIEKTAIGKHTLEMIEFFLDRTKGKLPMSVCDSQSPLNVATMVVNLDNFLMDLYMNPEKVMELLDRIANLIIAFYRKQEGMIGDCLVRPGHGFGSSRHFSGNGFSDDMIHMLSPDLYASFIMPSLVKAGRAFGGTAFHSCGNWAKFIDTVVEIPGLVAIDGAFSRETDPSPNEGDPFARAFSGTGILVNARTVGDRETVVEAVKGLWRPGMKLIMATYLEDPAEQEALYHQIHEMSTEK